jgi:Leu/Phe-tRNA-protein transferase
MKTEHLASLGAVEIRRSEFSARLHGLIAQPAFAWPAGDWSFDWTQPRQNCC